MYLCVEAHLLPSSFITLPFHFSSLLYHFLILLLHLLSVISSSSLILLLSFSSFLFFLLQGTYSIARSASAVMFTSNVRAKFDLPGGDVITETLSRLNLVPDDSILQNRSVVMHGGLTRFCGHGVSWGLIMSESMPCCSFAICLI